MEELKSLFGEGSLSYDEFSQKLSEAGETIKLANLKSDKYVDKDRLVKAETDLEAFKEKYNTLKTSADGFEKMKTEFETMKTDYSNLQTKYNEMERMGMIDKSNVNPKFAKFIYSEVNPLVNEKKDFQTCLDEYLKENSQYLKTSQGTYVNLQNGEGHKDASSNKDVNDILRNSRK